MNHTSKQLKQDSESAKKITNASTIPVFSDQRVSATTQLKQQQMMHSAHPINVIHQKSAEKNEPRKQGLIQPAVQMKAGISVNSPIVQLNKTGVGALIGGGIGAVGFLAGPVVGAITTTAGAAIGGMIGNYLTEPQKPAEPQDFGKFPANKNIDPDKVGEENNGIRELQEEQKRPDDVPPAQNYRLAMHKLHNVILVLEKADRSPEKNQSPDTAKLREKIVAVQKKAKDHAKHYKAGMRDLTSNEQEDNLKETYINGMDELTRELTNHTLEGENVIKKHGYLDGKGSLEEEGTNLWRDQWLKTKRAVDIALTSLWGGWKNTLKAVAKTNKGDKSANTAPNQQSWEQRINNENWDIFYGGSLMKGYKGPPKQNTRFLSSNFDVDANMDAPAVAEFLINEKGKKVDRGQLDPRGSGTRIEDMDKAMDAEVKKELVNGGLVPNAEAANKIISEEFETRVNAPGTLGAAANEEVDRSSDEQRVRDKLTGVRKLDPNKMLVIGNNLHAIGLLKDGSLDARPLTKQEIIQVETIIDAA